MSPILLVLPLVLLAGCSGVECGDGTEESDGECVVAESTDTAVVDGAPTILLFSSNVTSIDQGESVIFTALVTHPDGVGELLGGTLQSGSGAAYGAFATSGDEGAYQMTVSWSAINQINPISLSEGTDGSRPFLATFFDADGDTSSATIEVGLSCDGEPSCDGQCGRTCDDDDTGR